MLLHARILPRNNACNCQARKFLSHRCAVELHEFNAYLSTIYASLLGSTLREVSQKVCQKADKLFFFKMYVLKILSFYNFSVKMTRQKTLER